MEACCPGNKPNCPARERLCGERMLRERGFSSASLWLSQPPQLKCQTWEQSDLVASSSVEPSSQDHVEPRWATYTEPCSNSRPVSK